MTDPSLAALLNLRSEWEEITKAYKMPDNNGTIDTLEWFIENGHQGNRLRRRFDEALTIAKTIIEEVEKHYEQNPFVSSVCGETVTTLRLLHDEC